MERLEALFFDLSGTLLDDTGSREAILRTCGEIASARPGLDATRLQEANGEIAKPDPAIFAIAIDKLGVKPEHVSRTEDEPLPDNEIRSLREFAGPIRAHVERVVIRLGKCGSRDAGIVLGSFARAMYLQCAWILATKPLRSP